MAVDREKVSAAVETRIAAHPLITLVREEVRDIPEEWQQVIIVATGPLTSPDLAEAIKRWGGEEDLAFFDAIAPIVHFDSVNMDVAWFQSRYDKSNDGGNGNDYINCPMTEQEYEEFIDALLYGEKMAFKDWEENTPYFDGCMPIEIMASRGRQTLRWGPMKPVGLTNAHDGSHLMP